MVINNQVVQGKTTACAGCHGPDLKGKDDVPPLAGRSPSYLARQLYDFQQGTRNGAAAPLMRPVVATSPTTTWSRSPRTSRRGTGGAGRSTTAAAPAPVTSTARR
jgi:mono/diheme cytochrome c family protein